jgi:hypothetical protein
MVWGQLEMELAIICASAPAMRGFLSAVADRVTIAYGSRSYASRKYASQSRGTGATNLSNFSNRSGKNETHVYDGGISTFDRGIPLATGWSEKAEAEAFTSRGSDEFLTAPEKKYTLQKGIMVTETFSVKRDNAPKHDFGDQRPARL